MASLYFKSDGNGGFIIGKGAIAFITLIIILLSSVVSVVAYSVGVRVDVDHNTNAISINNLNINNLEEDQIKYALDFVAVETKIDTMQKDVTELKDDIKELLKHSGGK